MADSERQPLMERIDLYTVVHCKFSNPSLVWNGLRAAERLAICDLVVEPVAPLKVGSSVRVIQIESQPPTEADRTDLWTTCRRWRMGPCVAEGVVLGIRGYEMDMVELVVRNDSGMKAGRGGNSGAVDSVLVSVYYAEHSRTVQLCPKARMVRGLLRLFSLLPRSRTVQTMKMERFLEALDNVAIPTMSTDPSSAVRLRASQIDNPTVLPYATCSDSSPPMRSSTSSPTTWTFDSWYGVPLPMRPAEARFGYEASGRCRNSRTGFTGSLGSVPEDSVESPCHDGPDCGGDTEDNCWSDDDSSTVRGVAVGGERLEA